jgi:hypothetical protein
MTLPVIRAKVRVYNPDYDNKIAGSEFQIYEEREVEVVQLNLNSGGMRVRFMDQGPFDKKPKVVSVDISIDTFFTQYAIIKI